MTQNEVFLAQYDSDSVREELLAKFTIFKDDVVKMLTRLDDSIHHLSNKLNTLEIKIDEMR